MPRESKALLVKETPEALLALLGRPTNINAMSDAALALDDSISNFRAWHSMMKNDDDALKDWMNHVSDA